MNKTKQPRCANFVSRRSFISSAAKTCGAVALLGNLPQGWVGQVFADDSPETKIVRFGMIALTDCSPIVIAHEKGLFKKYGIESVVAKGANWAAIRDSLTSGDLQASHMLLGLPIASTMGLSGSPKRPMVVPWILNRNGQSITLKNSYKGQVNGDPKALKVFVEKAKGRGERLTFAMTFPSGTHAMWLRYYLGAGGINPDKDVSLITVPPPQMLGNMKVGQMDGFCVGEPWNARAVADGIGYTSVNTQDIWKDHPEKACAFLSDFVEKNPKSVKAVLKALNEASVWLDHPENRAEQARVVSKATYINCPPQIIEGRLKGDYDFGNGVVKNDPHCMSFSARNCNYPQLKYAQWFLTQYRRWGMVGGDVDYEGIAKKVMRPDLYEEAMKEIGYQHGGANHEAETLFDGVTFDPNQPESYAKSFSVHNLKA